LHYVDKHTGVKDFDVWSFYAQHDDWPFPPRWRGTRDFGPSKFGRYPGDPAGYSGRRVDILGRSLPAAPGTDPADAIRRYLAAAQTPVCSGACRQSRGLDRPHRPRWRSRLANRHRLRLTPAHAAVRRVISGDPAVAGAVMHPAARLPGGTDDRHLRS
jgi:hypothetical protein